MVPRSILVPVDHPFSEAPRLRVLERLAAAARSSITLLHVISVVNPAATRDTTSLNLARMQAKASHQEADASLWELTDQLRGHGLEAASLKETGDPAEVILSQADALKVDLLLMSTRLPGLAERLLLGSVAERILQRAHVPVLIVSADAAAWRASHPVDVLIALDGSPLAEQALPVGARLARLLEGDLHLLRVASDVDAATARTYLEDVSVALRPDGLPNIRRHVQTRASAAEAIRGYVDEHGVGLIALASHGRGGLRRAVLGSVAMEVVARAGVPVAVVPPQARTDVWK